MLATKRNNQFLIGLLLARLVEDTHVRLATIESLGGLAQTAGQTVVDEGDLEDTLECVQDGHLAAFSALAGHFDFVAFFFARLDGDFGGLFYIRLGEMSVVGLMEEKR